MFQTGGIQFGKTWEFIRQGSLGKGTIDCIMGNVGSSVFGAWLMQRQDISASSAPIFLTKKNLSLTSPPTLWKFNTNLPAEVGNCIWLTSKRLKEIGERLPRTGAHRTMSAAKAGSDACLQLNDLSSRAVLWANHLKDNGQIPPKKVCTRYSRSWTKNWGHFLKAPILTHKITKGQISS